MSPWVPSSRALVEEGKYITHDEDGAAAEHRKSPHRRACCSPLAGRWRRRPGFLELEEEEGKESYGRWRNHSADGVIYSRKWGRLIGRGVLVRLLPLDLIERSVWVKIREVNRKIPVMWTRR
jgi:hypothetical protein